MLSFGRTPVTRFHGRVVSLEAVGPVPDRIKIWISDRDGKKVVPIIRVAGPGEELF
jgi:hypothetical protein